MIEACRLCRQPYADLSGEGAALFGGRWNSAGWQVVYLAEHPALAVLEVLVHLDVPIELLPDDYVLLRVSLSDESAWEDILLLPADPVEFGTTWLREARGPLLRVPSSVVPRAHNYLLNPRHPDARTASVPEVIAFGWDRRLF